MRFEAGIALHSLDSWDPLLPLFLPSAHSPYSPVSIRLSNQAYADKKLQELPWSLECFWSHGICMSVACGGWMIAGAECGEGLPDRYHFYDITTTSRQQDARTQS